MQHDIGKLTSEMTLEEKAGLCSGLDNWHTKPVERLGIPSVMMTDGPHGLRKENPDDEGRSSYPATCFPSGSALACSWDRKLMARLGRALAEECRAQGVSILLGPAINIKRSPLCGRNFEYYSEDPLLAGELAAAYINGVQSQNVGVSLKHFAANNQETRRMTIDTVMDERTLREIYLANFETAVKKGKPWTVMCAYNKLLGEFCSENRRLLTEILRDEWGFDGMVMSDWGAVNRREDGLKAGLDLEMPSSLGLGDRRIIAAVQNGALSMKTLDQAAGRILRTVLRAQDGGQGKTDYDADEHHALARRIAGECMVLLKNDGVLPLKKSGKLAVIGAFARHPRFQGGGSSHVNPYKVDVPLEEILKAAGTELTVAYCNGYHLEMPAAEDFRPGCDKIDPNLINESVRIAAASDAAVIFAGLPDSFESEGYDRRHMRLPESHRRLIEAVAKVQKNIVVVLSNGSPVEMPWIDKVSGVLEGYLGGQAGGGAIADILFGKVNPSGKLAETFPVKLSDNPSYLNFPGETDRVEYREGLFVGYRYYDRKQIKPLFPFGFGLSYTTFAYAGISADGGDIPDTRSLAVRVKVKNTGKTTGKEIVELYVRDEESSVIRPEKELKAFEKVELQPGEEKTVTFVLDKRAFAYYDENLHDWAVETGKFEILAGGSSDDTPLHLDVTVRSSRNKKPVYSRNSRLNEIFRNPKAPDIFHKALGIRVSAEQAKRFGDLPLRAIYMSGIAISNEAFDEVIRQLNE